MFGELRIGIDRRVLKIGSHHVRCDSTESGRFAARFERPQTTLEELKLQLIDNGYTILAGEAGA